jgi:hypothetical protein
MHSIFHFRKKGSLTTKHWFIVVLWKNNAGKYVDETEWKGVAMCDKNGSEGLAS